MANGVGRVIREAREARGTAGRALARAVGVSPSYLCDVEHGRRAPSLDVLTRLAAHLPIESALRDYLDAGTEAWLHGTPGAVALLRALHAAGATADDLTVMQRAAERLRVTRCATVPAGAACGHG
jgi:transcriptional regulator with XRE-family HTH domain